MPKKEPQQFLRKSTAFQCGLENCQIIWATFVRKFVAKRFQKSPNVVTLASNNYSCPSKNRLPTSNVNYLHKGWSLKWQQQQQQQLRAHDRYDVRKRGQLQQG